MRLTRSSVAALGNQGLVGTGRSSSSSSRFFARQVKPDTRWGSGTVRTLRPFFSSSSVMLGIGSIPSSHFVLTSAASFSASPGSLSFRYRLEQSTLRRAHHPADLRDAGPAESGLHDAHADRGPIAGTPKTIEEVRAHLRRAPAPAAIGRRRAATVGPAVPERVDVGPHRDRQEDAPDRANGTGRAAGHGLDRARNACPSSPRGIGRNFRTRRAEITRRLPLPLSEDQCVSPGTRYARATAIRSNECELWGDSTRYVWKQVNRPCLIRCEPSVWHNCAAPQIVRGQAALQAERRSSSRARTFG